MNTKPHPLLAALLATALATPSMHVQADVIPDWNLKTGDLITEAKIGTPPAVRIAAIVQTAALQAIDTLPRGALVEAAIAAAHRTVLGKLMPAQQASIDVAYQAALSVLADGPAKATGIAVGE